MSNLDSSEEDPSSSKALSVDECIQRAGGFGRFQWVLMLWAGLARQGVSFYFYTLAYSELVPKLECKDLTLQTFEPCEVEDICNGSDIIDRDLWRVDYTDSKSFHNWMTDLELYCHSDFMIGLFGSMLFLGFALSGIGLKQSDRFGRKNTILGGILISLISVFILFFWRNLYAKYVGLLILGFIGFKNLAIYILTVESVPMQYQIYVTGWILSSDPLFTLIPATIFLMAGGKQLQHFFIVGCVVAVLSFFLVLLVPESPKFLFEKKRYSELRKNLAYMAKFNGVSMGEYQIEGETPPSGFRENSEENGQTEQKLYRVDLINRSDLTSESQIEAIENIENRPLLEKETRKDFSVRQELKNKRTLMNLICVIVIFCVGSFNYYMVGFYIKYVGDNIYINILASTSSEIAGNFAFAFIQKCIGSKKSLIVCFMLSLASAIPLLFVNNSIVIAICVFSGKFFIEGGFTVAYFVNPEIFHPLFVPFSFGLCNFVARIFTIFAPQVAEIKPRQTPVIVLMVLAFLATFLTTFMRKKK
ncbi:unnamed protein product [Moneuplotes crassus]|uniref:Uncharacterized protein n=1 Tax=Euplotes crassus TaxID=5936 RepID=A0AAD1XA74_EUPCR|nr:unnamed protein product [Moneuplotes crassus]